MRLGFVKPYEIEQAFATIESELNRYPNVDPVSFRRALDAFVHNWRD